jgi:hypothetical protein
VWLRQLLSPTLVEVRECELLTLSMPSARDPFTRVQVGPNRLRLLGFQFISVRRSSCQSKSTAEVNAEVRPLVRDAKGRINLHLDLLATRKERGSVRDRPFRA